MRQASSDGSHKMAITADIEEMTSDIDTRRVRVRAKALSDNKQLQEKHEIELSNLLEITTKTRISRGASSEKSTRSTASGGNHRIRGHPCQNEHVL